ncbi:relaxase/mobilization nuclease domain-containing protein [Inquilinus sp. NPDC058860]|uniref:relaxase/mobilization nuclease domain-containing protein n=1 Tax=Inquilinus sp. NPDC058860 TaxID=3346652 RepID=UPI00368CCBC4
MSAPDDDLRIRLGRIRSRGSGRRPTFVAQVLKAANKAGHVGPRSTRPPRPGRSGFGRGRLAFSRDRLFAPERRVVVKARVVRHKGPAFRSAPMTAHLSYLKREGVTRDGEKARMFDARSDAADDAAFAARCRDDRHHFRFIVSPEDAAEMTDLRAFTRDLAAQMERDLGTRLDWIAVDHWNTDNPHVHLLVRGVAEHGSDLVIARAYISRGLRARAEALVTLELGPKPEQAVRLALEKEVEAERWTRLDAEIRRAADEDGFIDLRPAGPGGDVSDLRRLMIGRLQRLERMGLAVPAGSAQWVVGAEAERTLRELGDRGDIIRTMHRSLAGQRAERALGDYVIHGRGAAAPIVGRLVDKGLHDELAGEAYAVIDGIDGRIHHLRFPDLGALEHAPPLGGIVEIRAARAELITRSDLDIQAQVSARGATWLDRHLVAREPATLSEGGFGTEIRTALEARIERLAEDGLARRQGQRVVLARNLLDTLRRREFDATAAALATETGLTHSEAVAGDPVGGTYRRRFDLASGRFAMIDDGLGFSLVPWSPTLERRLGQEVSGIVRADGGVDWSFGRKRGLGI